MNEKPSCFGTIFPILDRLEFNKPLKGKVFSVFVESIGIGAQSRRIDADEAAWEACRQCPAFQSCYDLSMARCALGIAVGQRI